MLNRLLIGVVVLTASIEAGGVAHAQIKPQNDCYVSGCSGQICSEDPDVITTCEWRDEYACFQGATCERQSNGSCGWTGVEECLNKTVLPVAELPGAGDDYEWFPMPLVYSGEFEIAVEIAPLEIETASKPWIAPIMDASYCGFAGLVCGKGQVCDQATQQCVFLDRYNYNY